MLKRYGFETWLLAIALIPVGVPSGSLAQQVHPDGKRKVIVEIRPVYPPLARKTNLTGIVRLRVTVSPAGYPVSTEQLGGSPVLVKAATEAVSRAKWEQTSVETKEIVQIKFDAPEK